MWILIIFEGTVFKKWTLLWRSIYVFGGGESPIYYFEPALCEQDIEQAKYAKMCSNVKILRVRSKTHGCAISPVALRKVMSYDVEQLEKLYQSCENKMKSSLWFSVKTAGVQNTLIYFGKKILKKIRS